MTGRRALFAATAIAALVAASAATPVAAQSLLAAGGLGVPVDPVDARGRALGAVGPGMFGTAVIPGDPAASLDLTVPTATFSLQGSWLSIEDLSGATSDDQGSRMSAVGIAYPVRGWGVASVTYGGVLDQRWILRRDQSLPLDAGGADVNVTDHFVSDGGVSAARLGFARRLTPKVGVGAAVGVLTGSLARTYTRSFDTLTAVVPLKPFQSGGRWSYSGVTGTLGAVFDLARIVRAAATVTVSGKLEADSISGSAVAKEYDMPIELRAGISGTLAPGLTAMVSGSYADWSSTGDAFSPSTSVAGKATGIGAGIELDRGTLFGRPLPLRAGWHRVELPFGFDGEQGRESAFVGGAGMYLVRAGSIPLAAIDLSVEKGSRTAGSFTEDFWRSTVSVRVAGF